MSTFSITKTDGGRTRIAPMTVAEPTQTVTRGDFDGFATDTSVDRLQLADLLSAFAMQERCAVHLYRAVAGRTSVGPWRDRYEEFGRQSEEHVRIYEDLLGRLHGERRYVGPMARLVEFHNSKSMESILLSGSVNSLAEEINDLELVMTAEQRCHSNWRLLERLARNLHETTTKRALDEAIRQVLPEEDEHLTWVKHTWEEVHLGLILQETPR